MESKYEICEFEKLRKLRKSMYLMDAENTIYRALIRKVMKESMSLYRLITQERRKIEMVKFATFLLMIINSRDCGRISMHIFPCYKNLIMC